MKDDILLVKITNDGQLDTLFGRKGITLTNLKDSDNVVFQSRDYVSSALVLKDGKILATGHTGITKNSLEAYFVRYHENGFLDEDFADAGFLVVGPRDSFGIGRMVFQSDGKILASGSRIDGTIDERVYFIRRYLLDLTLKTDDLISETIPNDFIAKLQLTPNLTQNQTTLTYQLQQSQHLQIYLTNPNDKIIQTIYQGRQNVGQHKIPISVNNLPKGQYWVTVTSANEQKSLPLMKF